MHGALSVLVLVLVGCLFTSCVGTQSTGNDEIWKEQLHSNLAVLGARNWVVIAESSYPSYTGTGVTTISTDNSSPHVFLQVLDTLERSGYVQPRIMVCSELRNIDEAYAPGIKQYRSQINKLLPGRLHYELPSRIINGQIEDAIKQFKVLVIKTSTNLPYSNIYIELDSGYWNADSETALRAKIDGLNKAKTVPATLEEKPAISVEPPKPAITKPQPVPPTDQLPPLPKDDGKSQPAPVSPAVASGVTTV